MSGSDQDNKQGLSRHDTQEVRKLLREQDGKESVASRVGRIMSYPPTPSGNVKRYRFGISLLMLAVFLMLLVVVLPNDDRRLYFVGFAFVMVIVAAWQIDLAKKR